MRKGKISIFNTINYGVLSIIAFLCIFPFWYIFVISISSEKSYSFDRLHFIPYAFDLSEYGRALISGGIMHSLMISAIITICGTTLSLLLTIPCSYALSKKRLRFRGIITGIIVFTMLFSGGMIPYYLVVTKLGLANNLLSLILPMAISAYNLIISKNFMSTIPESLEESVRIDGGNDLKIFTSIVIPLSKPLISVLALFYGVAFYNDYFNAVLFISSRNLYPLQVLLREMVVANVSMSSNFGGGGMLTQKAEIFKMACIIVGILPVLVIYPFLQKYFVTGVMLGAVKE